MSSTTTTTAPYLDQMFSLKGKTAIVTGGGSGIGAALAMGLARAGANVAIVGRRLEPLETTVQAIQNQLAKDNNDNNETTTTPQIIAVPCDITDTSSLPSLVEQAHQQTAVAPTILVNNAGVNVRQPAEDLTPEHWERSLNLMVTAPFFLTRAMVPHMQQQGYGRIISVASLQSYQAFPNSIPYATAKSGILGWTRAVAQAYGSDEKSDITANAIGPGFVKTELTETVFADQERADKLAQSTILKRNSLPQDLVGATVFLASPAASYITGQTLMVDGGFTSLGEK
mmetsp:Transcript_17308/g.40222  ORF Transcript_17308/g.40222 Transcript_17308/m.40222 type:complete len:285 (+) Transcript_17308:180-1034(+)